MKKALKIVAGAIAVNYLLNAGYLLGAASPIVVALTEGRDDDAEMLICQYDKTWGQVNGDIVDVIGWLAVDMVNLKLRLEKKNYKFVYVER